MELKTNNYWNALFNELINILLENLSISQKKIYFPEMLIVVYYWLKKLQKKFVFNFYKMKIKYALQLLDEHVDEISYERRNEGLKPDLIDKCKKFKLKIKKKSKLTKEITKIREEQETLRKQKILAEQEDDEERNKEEEDEEELDLDAPLSDEENLDLE